MDLLLSLLLLLLLLLSLLLLLLKEINIKNYYLDDQINVNEFHFEKAISDEKSYWDILIYYLIYKIKYSKKALNSF